MVCPRCGHPGNPAGANFCEDCGEPLVEGVAAPAETAAEPPADPALPPGDAVAPAAQEIAAAAPAPAPAAQAASPAVASIADAETQPLPPPPAPSTWTCGCGAGNPLAEQFCSECGEERPRAGAAPAAGGLFNGFAVEALVEPGLYTVRQDGVGGAPQVLLRFGSEADLTALQDACTLLGSPGGAWPGVASVVQAGSDAALGAWLVTTAAPAGWVSLDQAHDRVAASWHVAAGILTELLEAAERAGRAGRLLLLAPSDVATDGSHSFIVHPRLVNVPLDGPLLAPPGLVAPELLGRDGQPDGWRASAFAVGSLVAMVAGEGLGFPRAWHRALGALTAPDPAARPESAEQVALTLAAADAETPVVRQRIAMLTDIGNHHPVNQDSGGVWGWTLADGRPVALAVVADGVSAGLHSEDASKIAVQEVHDALEPLVTEAGFDLDRALDAMLAGGRAAQQRIVELPSDDPETASSTTLVAVCAIAGEAAGVWCGDSRAYGLTPEGCRQLSRDHSWINLVVDRGLMTLEEARRDPRAHVIARWLGPLDPPGDDPGFDSFRQSFVPGEKLLVCSDGLYMYFDPPDWDLKDLVTLSYVDDDPDVVVHRLVEAALARGGFDNITAAIVAFD